MQDAIQSLSFSMQANKGEFAVLLGSGVSRSAQIPTGWDITLDLVRKMAVQEGQNAEVDPVNWFKSKFGENNEPDYSILLDKLFPNQLLRQGFLVPHFEATEEDKESGIKMPTKAHIEIAALVASGHIKVIVTTNFDRLMEQAVESVGIVPQVISVHHDAAGARPFDRERCTILKVHGDYKDSRLLNTATELSKYKPAIKKLLMRVFQEYHLIICGWSAEYDKALCELLEATKKSKYSTYWASYSSNSNSAKKIQKERGAFVIDITEFGSDGFFSKIKKGVESIDMYTSKKTTSVDSALYMAKKFLAKSEFKIAFNDYVGIEIDDLVKVAKEYHAPENANRGIKPGDYAVAIAYMGQAAEKAVAIAGVSGYWSSLEDYYDVWKRQLERLIRLKQESGSARPLEKTLLVPSMLILYSLCCAAIHKKNWGLLQSIFQLNVELNRYERYQVYSLTPSSIFDGDSQFYDYVDPANPENRQQKQWGLDEWVQSMVFKSSESIFGHKGHLEQAVVKLEVLLMLRKIWKEKIAPDTYELLPFGYYWKEASTVRVFVEEIEQEIAKNQMKSFWATNGIFCDDLSQYSQTMMAFKQKMKSINGAFK
jgi:hypothetical protein